MPAEPEAGGSGGATETTPLVAKTSGDNAGGDTAGSGGGGGDNVSSIKGAPWLRQGALLLSCEVPAAVLALPRALVKTGWIGVPLMLLVALMTAFSRRRLADCLARLPRSARARPEPYAVVAGGALGDRWSAAASLAAMSVRFGACCVLALLAAQVLQSVLRPLLLLTFCSWLLVAAAAAAPLLLLTTRTHYPLLGLVSLVTIAAAGALYLVQLVGDAKPYPTFRYGLHGLSDVSLALGIMFFAFSGACAAPDVRDETDRRKFSESSTAAVCILLCLYLPLAIAGYAVLGEAAAPDFAQALTPSPLTLAANVLMLVHLLAAFLLVALPVCEAAEDLYGVKTESVGRRAAVRLSVTLALLFVVTSVPRFSTLMPLVGGGAALLGIVLPSLCHVRLAQGDSGSSEPSWMKTLCWEVVAAGAVLGAAAVFSGVGAIFGTSLATPCYFK